MTDDVAHRWAIGTRAQIATSTSSKTLPPMRFRLLFIPGCEFNVLTGCIRNFQLFPLRFGGGFAACFILDASDVNFVYRPEQFLISAEGWRKPI